MFLSTKKGCHFDRGPVQESVARLLRAELDAAGLGAVAVSASDENTVDEARMTWGNFSAATQAAVIARVNVHGYQQGGGRRDLLYAEVSAVGGTGLWNSEYGENDASGMSLAANLHLDFFYLHNTAWVYWQGQC